jgi:DNA/RNA endonuclease G (NUC1)/pimeloyl-ACP methyl ester carboxylesterase
VQVNPDGSVTLTLHVSVKVAGAPGAPRPAPEKLAPDPDYLSRQGYDPDFLPGFSVPFPKVTAGAPGVKARLVHPPAGGDPFELKYEHFSIVVNKTRKLPFVTAVNVDGRRSVKVDRKSGRVVHGANGDERAEATETWYVDPRLAPADQTDQPLYDRQSPRVFDRGHQVRREDPNWGDDGPAERANADTFHFTNCCPQEYRFNEQQRYWAGIEDYVLNNARAEGARVCVFTGPVFAATDPTYRGLRVPVQFFKVVARVEGGQLKATAFLASQAELLSALPERLGGAEGFDDVGRVREYLTSVAEIEEMTGLDFGLLRDRDTFRPESLGDRRPLLRDSDLRAALGGSAPAVRPAREAAEGLPTFSVESLSAGAFDWRTALSAALASQLAYQDGPAVEAGARDDWGLATCEFIEANETECFVASAADVALVAFRGTSSPGDWLANLDVLFTSRPYGKVHRGFFRALEDVQDRVMRALSDLGKSRVIVTGHSLGGALATVFAAEAPDDLPISWVYTFGQPRVGIGSDFTSAVNGRYGNRFVRFVNNNDVVPRVPPLPYRHVGRLVQFDGDGAVGGDPERLMVAMDLADGPLPLSETEFRALQQRLRSAGPASAGAAEGLFPSLADHALAGYVAKIAAQIG